MTEKCECVAAVTALCQRVDRLVVTLERLAPTKATVSLDGKVLSKIVRDGGH